MVIVAAILTVLATGLVLLRLGLRGVSVDDHPLCRACGFDLYGLVTQSPRGRCPECGADVSRDSQIRRGNRRPRRSFVRAGIACLVLAVTAGVPVFAAMFGGAKIHRYTPTWLLAAQAELRTDPGAGDVLKELLTRHGIRPLNQGVLARLGQSAAHAQARESRQPGSFSPEWRRFLEDPAVRALLPGAVRAEVEQRGASVNLLARRRINQGQPLPVRLGLDTDACFLLPGLRAGVTSGVKLTVLDAKGTVIRTIEHPVRTQFRTARTGARYWTSLAVPIDLPPGRYDLACVAELTLAATGPNWTLITAPTDPVVRAAVTQPLEIVGEGERTAALRRDEALARAMQAHLTVAASTSPYSATQTWIGIGMGVDFSAGSGTELERLTTWLSEPANMAVYRMVAHRADPAGGAAPQRIELGHCMVDYAGGSWVFLTGGAAADGPPPNGEYRLVLTPDTAHAETLVECEELLDGELVFEGVQIR